MSSLSKFDMCMIGAACVVCVTVGSCVTYFVTTRGQSNVNSGTTAATERDTIGSNESPVRGELSLDGLDETDSNVAKEVQKQTIHNELIIDLNDEIGGEPECKFPEMQLMSIPFIGKAKALACQNFQQLAAAYETRGRLSVGRYDFLIENIFKPSKYADHEVLDKINKAAGHIKLLDEVLVDEVDSLMSTSVLPSSGPRFEYDGIILYSEDDRDVAIQFRKDIHEVMKNDLNVILQEEIGAGGMHVLEEPSKFVEECMFIYVMVTPGLSEDKLKRVLVYNVLIDLIEKDEWRVLPVKTAEVRNPGVLKNLVSQSYYFYTKGESYKGIFEAGFRRSIAQGRSGKFSSNKN